MRTISFEEYNKKRKQAKLDFLKLRDNLEKKSVKGIRIRDKDKQHLLFKLAKKRRERFIKEGVLEKIGERKYRINFQRND